jgi:hypothetical protein
VNTMFYALSRNKPHTDNKEQNAETDFISPSSVTKGNSKLS